MNHDAKTIVITGASDGIGAAAARQLHADGHQVVIVGRSPQKTQLIADELEVASFVADFTRLADVRRLASDLEAGYPRIDVLANNAGGIFADRTRTADGFDRTFQVNHLAPFLLTQLLMDTLISSRANVVQTSSAMARISGKLRLDDLQHEKDFKPMLAYSTAKLDNILFTRELHTRFHDKGISAAAFHPGMVASNFAADSGSRVKHLYNNPIGQALMTSPAKAGKELVWLAEGTPGVDWQSGEYYEKRKPARRTNRQALDADLARELWDRSEQLLNRPSTIAP